MNFKQLMWKTWVRMTAENMNKSLDKTSVLRQPLQVGDVAFHTPSGARGVIDAIEKMNGVELITFTDSRSGLMVRRVNRQECRLANSERWSK